jgi:VanZ family protein
MTTNHVGPRLIIAARILLAAATVFIIYEATIKRPVNLSVSEGDKILHSTAFFTLALLSDFSFPARGYGFQKIALLVSYGILIELLQSILPWRSADVSDLLADCLGLVVYAGFIPLFKHLPLLRQRWQP